ncbi:hypothetical protein LTR38_005032, partial [Friedmanniomyces endolithicus]
MANTAPISDLVTVESMLRHYVHALSRPADEAEQIQMGPFVGLMAFEVIVSRRPLSALLRTGRPYCTQPNIGHGMRWSSSMV